MREFLIGMLGESNPHDFLHAFVWALVGVAISLLTHATNRDPVSTSSPVQFSWRFLIVDNAKRIILALLLIGTTLRFMPDILGIQLSAIASLGVGLGWDKLAQFFKDKGWLGSKEPKA